MKRLEKVKGKITESKIPALNSHSGNKLKKRLRKTLQKLGARSKPLKLPIKKIDYFTQKFIRRSFFRYNV